MVVLAKCQELQDSAIMASAAFTVDAKAYSCSHNLCFNARPQLLPRALSQASRQSGHQARSFCRQSKVLANADNNCRKAQHRNGTLGRQLLGLTAAGITTLAAGSALATSKVGEFSASGFIFKDSVETVAVEDPDVTGVTIYISDFHRSLSDKLNKDFFSEPSQASVTCALTAPLKIKDYKAIAGSEGHEVFSERKGLSLFQNKTLRVRRLYDDKNNTLIYVAYSTRLDGSKNTTGSRYKTSICALPVAPSVSPAVTAPSASYPDAMK